MQGEMEVESMWFMCSAEGQEECWDRIIGAKGYGGGKDMV